VSECTKCGHEHRFEPFQNITDEELDDIDVEAMLFPVMSVPNLGMTTGDEEQLSVFLKILGVDRSGTEFTHQYMFSPSVALRIAASLTTFAVNAIEDPEGVKASAFGEATKPLPEIRTGVYL
jgi:hypothetical protein